MEPYYSAQKKSDILSYCARRYAQVPRPHLFTRRKLSLPPLPLSELALTLLTYTLWPVFPNRTGTPALSYHTCTSSCSLLIPTLLAPVDVALLTLSGYLEALLNPTLD